MNSVTVNQDNTSPRNTPPPNGATSALTPDVESRLQALADQLYNVDHVTGEVVTSPPPKAPPQPWSADWWGLLRRIDAAKNRRRGELASVMRKDLRRELIDRAVSSLGILPVLRPAPGPKQCKATRGCRLREGHAGACGKRIGPSCETTGPLGALPTRRPTGEAARTSLVTPISAYAHKEAQNEAPKTPDFCPDAVWSWDYQVDGAGRKVAAKRSVIPCGRWKCEPCRGARLSNEIAPEIRANMDAASKRGWTLKLLTLTFTKDELAGENTPAGAHRRKLEQQHFIQWLRRSYPAQRDEIRYLRVAETHKSGRIHLHLLIAMPYIPQRNLQARWGRRVDVRPVYARCPSPKCWPGRAGSDAQKKRARVMLRGNSYSCANGHTMNRDQAHQRFAVSASHEIGKYLTKQSDVGRMSRSRNWIKAVPPMPKCEWHVFEYAGSLQSLAAAQLTDQRCAVEDAASIAYQLVPDMKPCECWSGVEWVRLGPASWARSRENSMFGADSLKNGLTESPESHSGGLR